MTRKEIVLNKITTIYKEAAENLSYFNVKEISDKLAEAERLMKENFPDDYNRIQAKRRRYFDFVA